MSKIKEIEPEVLVDKELNKLYTKYFTDDELLSNNLDVIIFAVANSGYKELESKGVILRGNLAQEVIKNSPEEYQKAFNQNGCVYMAGEMAKILFENSLECMDLLRTYNPKTECIVVETYEGYADIDVLTILE